MSSTKQNKRKKRRCACCKTQIRYKPTLLSGDLFISRHHLVFTSDALHPTEKPGSVARRQLEVIDSFRDKDKYGTNLCMAYNKHTPKENWGKQGCHDKFNEQITHQCCGVQNRKRNSCTYVVIGICPLISQKKPIDPTIILPNKFCQFCFYFHMIYSPSEFMPLIQIINKSPHYAGKITLEDLNVARELIKQRGFEVKKISVGGRTRWKLKK